MTESCENTVDGELFGITTNTCIDVFLLSIQIVHKHLVFFRTYVLVIGFV